MKDEPRGASLHPPERRSSILRVRTVAVRDAAPIAALAGQLGYPSTTLQVRRRIEMIRRRPDHCALVAETAEGLAVGWLHVFISRLLESAPGAEIGGLVVDEGYRGRGIGKLLIQHAEAWARAQGCQTIRLRSNIIRQDAHAFYAKLGYRVTKTQHAFAKKLRTRSPARFSRRARS